MRRLDPSITTASDSRSVTCPYCGSSDTEREHPKGSSLCRSMHFCHSCEQPFERVE